MNVLHVANAFSPISQTFVYDAILALEQTGRVRNTVLTGARVNRRERPFERVKLLPYFDVVSGRGSGSGPARVARLFAPFYRAAFARALHTVKPDVIHCHFAWSAVAASRLLGDRLREPMLVSLHGTDVTYRPAVDSDYRRQLLDLAASDQVLFTVNSDFLRGIVTQLGVPAHRVRILPNAVNPRFQPARKRALFRPGDRFHVVNTARFVPWKGQELLIRAFAGLVRDYPNALLTLIGDGETLGSMQDLTQLLGIADRVRFLGEVPHAALPDLLNDADVYVQPSILDPTTSQVETFGISVLEAIACGLPVVITNTGGIPEMAASPGHEGVSYFVVPGGDVSALRLALEGFVTGRQLVIDNAEYARAKARQFSLDNHTRGLERLYTELLGAAG
jgi:glycosyltransferase involved in cell wall biosynthesis